MKVLLAVSGGIDSMCMADMYSRTEQEYAVAHCNFHLRDKDSDADAELVRKWADSHGVRYFQADFDTAGYAAEHGISIEMAAREQRYAWFSFIADTQGFDAVATAHNANDNAETLILNLLRGTGSRGLRGMPESSTLPSGQCPTNRLPAFGPSHKWAPPSYVVPAKRRIPLGGAGGWICAGETGTGLLDTAGQEAVKLIRPLLGMSRADIEKYAQEHGIQYREDRTNAETVYKRNRIRNIIFPEFEKINPSFIRTLNEDMARFKEVNDIVEDWFIENAGTVFDGSSIDIHALLSLKHWRYMLFRLLEPFGFNASVLGGMTGLLEGIAIGKVMTVSGKRFYADEYLLETSTDRIKVLPMKRPEDLSEGMKVLSAGTYCFSGCTVIVEDLDYTEGMTLKSEKGTLLCDAQALGYPFILRHWHAGDWIRPFGMGGKSKKISDLFTDLKLSLAEKESSTVIYSPTLSGGDSAHVAAIAGYRMDEALRISKGSKQIIKITIL